jgi:hypothetical protein
MKTEDNEVKNKTSDITPKLVKETKFSVPYNYE